MPRRSRKENMNEHQMVNHKQTGIEAAAAHPLGAACGYAALLQQWDGRIKVLSDMQRRYAEQGAYAEAMVARARWQMLITCCNDLKQHTTTKGMRDERTPDHI
jgi:hypothetical protein